MVMVCLMVAQVGCLSRGCWRLEEEEASSQEAVVQVAQQPVEDGPAGKGKKGGKEGRVCAFLFYPKMYGKVVSPKNKNLKNPNF